MPRHPIVDTTGMLDELDNRGGRLADCCGPAQPLRRLPHTVGLTIGRMRLGHTDLRIEIASPDSRVVRLP